MTTEELTKRTRAKPLVEIELSPHSLTHRTADNQTVQTHALKVDDRIYVFTRMPPDYKYSTMMDSKLIPF